MTKRTDDIRTGVLPAYAGSGSNAIDLAAASGLAGLLKKTVGGFAMSEDAIERIMHEANGSAGGFLSGRMMGTLLDRADTGALEAVASEARRHTGSFLDGIAPARVAMLAEHPRAAFADGALRSALSDLQNEFGDRYDRAFRGIAGVGSLGGIVASLATGNAVALAGFRRLLEDAAACGAGETLRSAHSAFLPSLRPASASEIEQVVSPSGQWSTVASHRDWYGGARSGVRALTLPWVREDRPDLSVAAMSRFGRLAGVVANSDPRDPMVADEVRSRLGDYRGGTSEDDDGEDPAFRVARRYDRGFDPVLSSVPTRIVLAMLEPFDLRIDTASIDEEFGIDDIAAQMVRRLEARLMVFVRDALHRAWGDEWIMHVPKDVRERLRRRQRQAEERGRAAAHAIVHADFGDWIKIIGVQENWPLFAGTFGSFDVVQEALEQIRPIRHDASHPRGVGPEDLLVLAVNGKRVMRWIDAG